MRNDQIHYTLQFDVAEGKMAEFESYAKEAIDYTEANEPGTIVYRWQIEGSKVQLHERFTDEAAMLAHMGGKAATEAFPKLMEVSEVTRFDVHGDVSDEAAEGLLGFGATIFSSWKGFDR